MRHAFAFAVFAALAAGVALAPSSPRAVAQEAPGVIFVTTGNGGVPGKLATDAEVAEVIAFKALRDERGRLDSEQRMLDAELAHAKARLAALATRQTRHLDAVSGVCAPIRKRLGVGVLAPILLDESGERAVFRDLEALESK